MHGFRCYDNIAPNAKCQRVIVLALCLVMIIGLLVTSLVTLTKLLYTSSPVGAEMGDHLRVYHFSMQLETVNIADPLQNRLHAQDP